MKLAIVLLVLLTPLFLGTSFAHTVDSVGKYRLEIGWMNEPVVSGETNAIELLVSPLSPCPQLDSIKCAESQEFENGISGLEKSLKIQLVYKDQKIILPLNPDHNILGKYHAFVTPTSPGFYQANLLGKIDQTTVSLSMHPPKVDDRSYIEFPESSDLTLNQLIDGHTALVDDINDLKESVLFLKQSNSQYIIGYIGMGIGMIAVTLAGISLIRSKK